MVIKTALSAVMLMATAASANADYGDIDNILKTSDRILTGSHSECVGGDLQSLTYNVTLASDVKYIEVNDLPIKDIRCPGKSSIELLFKDKYKANKYCDKMQMGGSYNGNILVGGFSWSCRDVDIKLRRIVDCSKKSKDVITVKTSAVEYDEIYEDADIDINNTNDYAGCRHDLGGSHDVCLPWNTDCNSGSAKKSFPIDVKNAKWSLECKECFTQFKATAVATLKIRKFKLREASIGFRNMELNTSTVFQVKYNGFKDGMQRTFSKEFTAFKKTFKFSIAWVPFVLTTELPVSIKGEFRMSGDSITTFGTAGNIDFGNLLVSYDEKNKWKTQTPKATPNYEPVLTNSGWVQADTSFRIQPSVKSTLDGMFEYKVNLEPNLAATIRAENENKKYKACLNSSFDFRVTHQGGVRIKMNDNKNKWGPEKIYSKHIDFPQKCVQN